MSRHCSSYGLNKSRAFGDMACFLLQEGRGMRILLCPDCLYDWIERSSGVSHTVAAVSEMLHF
jgi:hypothetical protein